MKNILFSKSSSDTHKIFNILGFKIKIKNHTKILLDELNPIKTKLSAIQQDINKINIKCKKDFIIDNIDNSKFFNLQQDIFYFYQEMMSRKFYDIFKYRLSRTMIDSAIAKCIKKTNNDNIYVLSDIKNFPKRYKVVDINDIEGLSNTNALVVLAYNNDFSALEVIKILKSKNIQYMSLPIAYPLARYFHTDKCAFDALCEEAVNPNWHFCPGDFENIFQAIKNAKNLDGAFVEIGTFRGDSGAAALNYMEKTQIIKPAYFIDTFEGFTYEEAYSSEDIYWQGTHFDTSFETVSKRFEKYKNANVIKSNIITDDLPHEIDKICVANIDVDMYEAVKAALYKVKDKIVKHGIIIAEDYGHTPGLIGAQKAANEFLEENPDKFITIYLNSGQLLMINKG